MIHNEIATGNTEKTKPENRAFYPALDGLRAIAFFLVFACHRLDMPWGWAGVDIFFVLSGFLITGILFDSRDDKYRVRNFYIRRTLRIFPLYYAILLLVIIAYPVMHWRWSAVWLLWPVYMGNFIMMLHPAAADSTFARMSVFQMVSTRWQSLPPFYLGHFWTLCVEEQFYLVWPWIVFWIKDRRKLLWICGASLPVCLAARILAMHTAPAWLLQTDSISHATPLRADDLLLGGMLALLLRGPIAAAMLLWTRRIAPFTFAFVFLWIVHITPFHHLRSLPYPYPRWLDSWGFTAIALLAGMLILLAIQPGSAIYKMLRARPLRWIGRISYGAYVFHDIFGGYCQPFTIIIVPWLARHMTINRVIWINRGVPDAFVLFGLTILLAWLSFRFFESPFLNLKERWTIR